MDAKSQQLPDMSFARVLVVDDMPSIQVVAAGLMKKYKIQVDCVGGGEEAVSRVRSGEPVYAAIFMDHIMPGVDGMEAVKQIRALDSEYARNIPIIAMTGDENAENGALYLQNGFQAYLGKPLSLAKLDPVLREWITPR